MHGFSSFGIILLLYVMYRVVCMTYNVADLAQSVERFPRKEKVASSILAISIDIEINLDLSTFCEDESRLFFINKGFLAHKTAHGIKLCARIRSLK